MSKDQQITEVSLDSLSAHPRQSEFFSSPSQAEIEELAEDLLLRGQQEPIHICPDGTILRGHRRVAAAKVARWKTIKAIIRHDLSDPLSESAVSDLISDNLYRQQLDDLALARCYHELKKTAGSCAESKTGDLRDRLATRLKAGRSGRSLDRLERLLKLPRDIQDMISTNQLNKSQAEKILQLPHASQSLVFDDLRCEERIADTLRKHGIIRAAATRTTEELGEQMVAFFRNHLGTMSRNLKAFDRLQVRGADVVILLEKATRFLSAVTKRKQMLKQQTVDAVHATTFGNKPLDNLSGESR